MAGWLACRYRRAVGRGPQHDPRGEWRAALPECHSEVNGVGAGQVLRSGCGEEVVKFSSQAHACFFQYPQPSQPSIIRPTNNRKQTVCMQLDLNGLLHTVRTCVNPISTPKVHNVVFRGGLLLR